MIIEERDRVNVLIALLRNAEAELIRYRDKEWQITAYVVALELSFAGGWPFMGLSKRPGQWYLLLSCAFLALVGAVGVYFLVYVHSRLNDGRVVYSTILSRLGLGDVSTEGPEMDAFQFSSERGPASEFLRPRWNRKLTFNEGRGVVFVFIFIALIMLVGVFSIFIVVSKAGTSTTEVLL